jgi:uncharacterized protein YcbX
MRLTGLYIYPIKSCAPLTLSHGMVEARGLMHDRRWMIVDPQGHFVTGRQEPRLVLIQAEPGPLGLRLRAPAMPELFVPPPKPDGKRATVEVWGSQVDAVLADPKANAWLSRYLSNDVRLVSMDAQSKRYCDVRYAQSGDVVSFADGYPLLLISQGSLDGLNARLYQPVSMLRFRPNLVVDSVPEHAEDGWKRIRIGNIEFDVVKPCTRCGFTTVMPESGTLDPTGEPLKTLARYRRAEKGVTFGQNVIARGRGRIAVGDKVELLA